MNFRTQSYSTFNVQAIVMYRFGFNGMEMDDDVYGYGMSYTTEFRQNDPRLGGRWWSTDPIVKPWESPYAGYSNNPIYFIDPSGLDPGVKHESDTKNPRTFTNEELACNELDICAGDIIEDGGKQDFDITIVDSRKPENNEETIVDKAKDFIKDINPIKDVNIYLSMQAKVSTSHPTIKGGKFVTPKGHQFSYSSSSGLFSSDKIGKSNIYFSTSDGINDIRYYPFAKNGANSGDWTPGFRYLRLIAIRPITIPVEGVPIPIGTIKGQFDSGGNLDLDSKYIGGRLVGETLPIKIPVTIYGVRGDVSLEISTGFKIILKTPNFLK